MQPGRTCQFIAGMPTADDQCKCGMPVDASGIWCRTHADIVYERGGSDDGPDDTDDDTDDDTPDDGPDDGIDRQDRDVPPAVASE